MSKLIGPDFIALQVRDLEASRRFYSERIGLVQAAHSPPNAVVFDTKPIPLAIRSPLVDLSVVDRLGWGFSLWLASDDADGLHARLAAADVSILSPPSDGPFGRFFSFSDPDGYAITIHTAGQASPRTTLEPDAGHISFVNTFVVKPGRTDELFDVLSRATEETIRYSPGFISANLHVSQDGGRVLNYAQWRSEADYQAMLNSPEAQNHLRAAAEIAESFDPVIYDLREVHSAGEAL